VQLSEIYTETWRSLCTIMETSRMSTLAPNKDVPTLQRSLYHQINEVCMDCLWHFGTCFSGRKKYNVDPRTERVKFEGVFKPGGHY
jgi:hypothetical protein